MYCTLLSKDHRHGKEKKNAMYLNRELIALSRDQIPKNRENEMSSITKQRN
jgi:hypothetical protein